MIATAPPDPMVLDGRWLTMPQQIEAKLAEWQQRFPEHLRVDEITQYTGHRCLALTVAEPGTGDGDKPAAWFCVPHAHEPAGTAAIMDFIEQLLSGRDLAGRPAQFDHAAARRRLLLTFNPDANPGGRAWSPVILWDGTRYPTPEVDRWAFGIDPETGKRWPRVNRWDVRERQPLRRGLVYEQVSQFEFVEPNRDPGSSMVRLYARLDARHRYARALHLHQMYFGRIPGNGRVFLPSVQDELPGPVRDLNASWASAVLARWGEIGGDPEAAPVVFTPDEATQGWFRTTWADFQRRTPHLFTEVQTNNVKTPPDMQVGMCLAAIQLTIEQLLDQGS